jgi:multicomponent Na+:H+ antiporter subunit D
MEAHQVGILLILIASTVLNVGYFAPVTYRAFFGKRPAGEVETGIREAPLSMLVPLLIAVTVSVIIGIFPNFMMQFVRMVTG